jgi:4-amino-4-deoxy-L-arabinose transferase-like glycosyltransferase
MVGVLVGVLLAVLPLLALASMIAQQTTTHRSWRDGVVSAAVWWGVLLVAITEALSAFGALGRVELALAWGIATLIAILIARGRGPFPRPAVDWQSMRGVERLQLAAIVVAAVLTLFSALVAAPSTADSMTYHLARVAHWIQNRTVAFYPTHIERQLWPGPGAELIVMNFQALAGSDRVATLVQWLAYLGDVCLASLLARQLAASRRGQLWAAFFAAMIPGAVAQASGTQVELVFAFWLCCAVSIGLRLRSLAPDTHRKRDWASLGAAIGLAILTKATAYLFLAPFLPWLLAYSRRLGITRAAGMWIVAAITAALIVSPHYSRNVSLYGHPLGRPGTNGELNETIGPAVLVSNVLRNTALEFGIRSQAVNETVFNAIEQIHGVIGISDDDRRTTFLYNHFGPQRFEYAEQTASAPLTVLIIVVACLFLLLRWRSARSASYLIAAVFAGFLLFSLFLKWQPWHSRLLVPLMILASAPVGLFFERVSSRVIQFAIAAALILAMLPALLINPYRPLVFRQPVYTMPREERYFTEDPRIMRGYIGAADYLASRRCSDVAFWFRGDGFEYQMWALLRNRFPGGFRVRHVFIRNPSNHLAGEKFRPCAIVYVHPEVAPALLPIPSRVAPSWELDDVRIYEYPWAIAAPR